MPFGLQVYRSLNLICAFHIFSILHTNGLTAFIQWCECYARCDWSLSMIYKSTDTWMTSQETSFLCFVWHGTRFWKCLWHYFAFKQVKASKKKVNWSYWQRKKMDKRRQNLKELFTTWECPNYKKSSQQLPSCATRLAVLQNVFATILLWARKDVAEKVFEEIVYM